MAAKPGDTIRAPSEKLGQPERRGKIVEILGDEKHPRFKVRWDDAHEPCSFPVPMSASRATDGHVTGVPKLLSRDSVGGG